MQAIGLRPKIQVSTDGSGVVGHAGARLLADLADATGLTAACSTALRPLRPRGTGHDPGRIATDLAVMLADGGEAIADLAVLRDQAGVFGPVASTPTAWRLLADVDDTALASLASARAQAREIAWLQADEHGKGIPAARAAGRVLPGLVLDLDATLVTCHSEKEQAAPTYKGGFGFHPLLCFLANTGEALSGRLRPGNAGANTATDHITVLDQALAQIPDAHRYGTDILVRTDSAGSAKAFLAHIRDLRKRGVRTYFSVGYAITEPVRRALRALPDRLWHPALDQDGTLRDGAEVAELTGMVDLDGYPAGTRIIVRRERPHPGAQLSLFDQDEGLRHQVFLTDTPYPGGGAAQFLEVATADMPPSRTASGAARPLGSAASPLATSTSMPPGSNSASQRSTCWPGCASCCWTVNSRLLSRRSSATGCCTSPPASPAAAGVCTCGYRRPGPGDTNSPRLSTASPHCPVPLADQQTPARPRPERPWRTRPPRRDSAMTKQRKHFAHPTAGDQRLLIDPTETARLEAVRDWLTVVLLPGYAPELNPVEGLWAHIKRSLANLAARTLNELETLLRRRLKALQYRHSILDGFLAGTRLALDRPN